MTSVIAPKRKNKMGTDTRAQMVDTAVLMLRRHGYNGMGFRQVVVESGAPRGSMYHHFPGGKAQLGIEAVTYAGNFIERLITDKLQENEADVVAGIESVWRWWVRHVDDADLAGCPVFAVAIESHPDSAEVTEAAASAFDSWVSAFAAGFRRAGMDARAARDWGLFVLSALEGATGITRAHGDLKALRQVGARVADVLRVHLSS